ncbi:MAG: universal stress protein [Planctomycetes bacterium]|nr:universal stress protein [Planctomycetota bacterium]
MNILVAIDFSDGLDAVLSEVRKWANFTHPKLWLIHVTEPQPDFIGYGPDIGLMSDPMAVEVFASNSQTHQNARDTAARRLREKRYQLQELAETLQISGTTVTPLLLEGPVTKTILEEATKHEASMIIVGSHGHGTMRQLLLGSVSEGVLRKSSIPVLVIPTHHTERT